MATTEAWTREKRRARWIGGGFAALGIAVALIVAVVWGSPASIGALHLGRLSSIFLAAAILVVVLAIFLPLAIGVAGRARQTPPYLASLKLSSVDELMVRVVNRRIGGRQRRMAFSGFVSADWAHWGPAARVVATEEGFRVSSSHWPVLGRRAVPHIDLLWDDVHEFDIVAGERNANILVVKTLEPRIAFGLWLGPLGSQQLEVEFNMHCSRSR